MVKVKICGITNQEDANKAAKAGCDALGFLFYKKSPRYISPRKAMEIIRRLPKKVIKIGVFVNAKEKTIIRIAKTCGLDILQFHGNESPEFCAKFKEYKVIKSFRVKDKFDLTRILKYNTFAYLFDAFVKSKPGGTGRSFDWDLLKYLDNVRQPIFLSGGLNGRNVSRAIKIARPDWVDASSSLEIRPGKKDSKKIKEFVKIAKSV